MNKLRDHDPSPHPAPAFHSVGVRLMLWRGGALITLPSLFHLEEETTHAGAGVCLQDLRLDVWSFRSK